MDSRPGSNIFTIDFDLLMDLRVDYVFKLLFIIEPRLLVSLLNAIFANKKIPRVIKSLTIKNPYLEKKSGDDKLSILDIRAELDDGTNVLIEMHMYGLGELKAKTIRSWSRAHGEDLKIGGDYSDQPPTISIAFTDGKLKSFKENIKYKTEKNKIHRHCMIMDCEDFSIFTDAMELHYIDMKAFAKAVNKAGSLNINETEDPFFIKWLALIAHVEINDKTIIKHIFEEEEDLQMAVSILERLGEDQLTRQAYLRRKDEIYFYNKSIADLENRIEQEQRRAEQEQRRAEQAEAALTEKDEALAEKDAQIARLLAQLSGDK